MIKVSVFQGVLLSTVCYLCDTLLVVGSMYMCQH